MKRQMSSLLLGISMTAAAGDAAGRDAWWQLCDWCTSESHFQHQALNVPGDYTPIFVTNRDTNVTRKYDRWTSIEDLDGTLVQWTEVSPADFPSAEKQVFEQAVEGANTVFASFDRSEIVAPGLQEDPGTVAGDISNGQLSQNFVNAAILQIQLRNLMPTAESVSASAGVTFGNLTLSIGKGKSIRDADLLITIDYDDGSLINFRLKPDGSIVGWTILDADGNEVPLTIHSGDGPIPIAGDSFADRDRRFGSGSGGHAEQLAATINGMTGGSLECETSISGSLIVVSCVKVK